MAMIPWRTRLRRKRTPEGVQDLATDAWSWNSCAVGERRTLLEKVGCTFSGGYIGSPVIVPNDPYIARLGRVFAVAVDEGAKEVALEILDELDRWIEKRT